MSLLCLVAAQNDLRTYGIKEAGLMFEWLSG